MLTAVKRALPRRNTNGKATAGALAARLGLRRIHWVRVVVGRHGTRADAVGLTHRLPRTVPIPVAFATRLAAAGVPMVVRDADTES